MLWVCKPSLYTSRGTPEHTRLQLSCLDFVAQPPQTRPKKGARFSPLNASTTILTTMALMYGKEKDSELEIGSRTSYTGYLSLTHIQNKLPTPVSLSSLVAFHPRRLRTARYVYSIAQISTVFMAQMHSTLRPMSSAPILSSNISAQVVKVLAFLA